jgi:hypothetical protein
MVAPPAGWVETCRKSPLFSTSRFPSLCRWAKISAFFNSLRNRVVTIVETRLVAAHVSSLTDRVQRANLTVIRLAFFHSLARPLPSVRLTCSQDLAIRRQTRSNTNIEQCWLLGGVVSDLSWHLVD